MRPYLFIILLGLLSASCRNEKGTSVDEPSPIELSAGMGKSSCVYLSSDEKGTPLISWCEIDKSGKKHFFVAFFDEKADAFGSPITVPIEQNANIHEEGMPKVATKGDGNMVAIYEVSLPTKTNQWAGTVRFLFSSDKGKRWSKPRNLPANSVTGGTHSFASLVRLENGEIGACWLDEPMGDKKHGRPVKFAHTKGIEGFTDEVLVDSGACECCRTAISSGGGRISIVYRGMSENSVRDIAVATSLNNGKSFSKPISFSGDNWKIDGCPHNGPGVVNTANRTYSVWYTGGEKTGVYYGELDNKSQTSLKTRLSDQARNIQLAMSASGDRLLAYSEPVQLRNASGSKIVVSKVQEGKMFTKNITSGKTNAAYPVLMSYGKDKLVVAWTENDKVFYALTSAGQISDKFNLAAGSLANSEPAIKSMAPSNTADPVCGMELGAEVQYTVKAKGKIIGFCSISCKERYLKIHRPIGSSKDMS